MKKLDILANDIAYGNTIDKISSERNIGITEARILLSQMSFADYHKMNEAGANIVPPSGNVNNPVATSAQPNAAVGAKSTWTGKGPISVGMTVGLKGQNGLPVPGEVSQVDATAKGVKIKNPTTGQDEWMNMNTLQPFMATSVPGQPNVQQPTQPTQESQDDKDLTRLRQLAGVEENCSGGASSAGAIASVSAPMGQTKKRNIADESLTPEYTPKSSAKTIIGDTKPNQASGKLSADLAASGKLSAGRINNGRKR